MAAAELFPGFSGALGGPYIDGEAVTAHDTNDFANVCSALWVATAQTALAVVTVRGTVLNMGAIPAGTLLPIRCKRVNSTNTSPGTGIVALR
jgi:uncharacterized hydantoinase/oxoprolinase family protein